MPINMRMTRLFHCCHVYLPIRFMIALMCFLNLFNNYALRVNLSVAIVAMVNHSAIPHLTSQDNATQECTDKEVMVENDEDERIITVNQDGPFVWDESIQGMCLSSYYLGYLLTNLIGGRVAELTGAKKIMGVTLLMQSICSICIPIAGFLDWRAMLLFRVLQGAFSGVTFPALQVMMSLWVPPHERSFFSGFIYSGSVFGIVCVMPLTGVICVKWGWEASFYVTGAIGILSYLVWWLLVYDSPDSHPLITDKEKAYITGSIGSSRTLKKIVSVPWREIFTSKHVWAMVLAQTGADWSFYTLLSSFPTYMKYILKFDLGSNGTLSAMSYLISIPTSYLGTYIADSLIKRNFGVLKTRRIFAGLAFIPSAVGLVAVSYSGCHKIAAIIYYYVSVSFQSLILASVIPNSLELAPNYAGTLFGITNTFCTLAGLGAPVFTGFITLGQQTTEQWRKIFLTSAGINITSFLIFVSFASGKEQPWNKQLDDDEDSEMGENIKLETRDSKYN